MKYPGLSYTKTADGYEVTGLLFFSASHNGVTIQDEYQLIIRVPLDYPKSLPMVFECGEKIPRDFEHVSHDDTLCLGIPMEIRKSMIEDSSLIGFVDRYLVSYLYSASYYRKYGVYPYGERAHGVAGIYEYYFELFQTENRTLVHKLLLIIYQDKYRGHVPCVCGSEFKLRDCHGGTLFPLLVNPDLKEQAITDLIMIARAMEE